MPKVSIAHAVKRKFKSAMLYISNFETIAVEHGLKYHADTVVCGHIHIPKISNVQFPGKNIKYFNSGDWIENLSALEYNEGDWALYYHNRDFLDLKKDSLIDQEYSNNCV